MFTKGCSGFSLFCLDLELFAKILKRPGFYEFPETRFFTFLLITLDLNKLKKEKKSRTHFFRYCYVENVREICVLDGFYMSQIFSVKTTKAVPF